MKNNFKITLVIILIGVGFSFNKQATYKIAVLKYNGGGDWYSNPTSLSNLIKYCNENISTNIDKTPDQVHVGSEEIFNYPFLHMTGHGNVIFSADDISNLIVIVVFEPSTAIGIVILNLLEGSPAA